MVAEPSTIALGAELLGRMLAQAPDCDAIFCCNDDLAHGAIYQCQRRGIAGAAQLAICGFNDLPASAWMNPSVTTIGTPRYRIGFEAASPAARGDQGRGAAKPPDRPWFHADGARKRLRPPDGLSAHRCCAAASNLVYKFRQAVTLHATLLALSFKSI
jgi:hypothetical protein